HWKYKEGRVGANRDEQYFAWLRRLLELQQDVRDPEEFMHNLRIELYPEEVYIFTPKGEVKSLPRGSTAVDFAYFVHTDVGHQCVGARINGRMVPLRTRLSNGDIVEIVTQAGHTPSRDWLGFAVTSRARNKIKHFIHGEEKTRSVDLGRRLFEKEVRRYSVEKALVSDDALGKIAGEFGVPKAEDVLAAIGYGKVTARAVLTRLAGHEGLREKPSESAISHVARRVFGGPDDQKIKVRGIDDLMVFRARCCNPIRGENIVGYITRGKGVSVHSATCTNVINLLFDPERRIAVEWDQGHDNLPYIVRLKIRVEDRRGILAAVSSRIADIDTNIKDVEATVDDNQRGSIRMTVEISDVKHLDRVVKSIKKVDGVLGVERTSR
ncbi:MAG: TGS domain-containing protein, partial [Acidobacteriota bacterium]